MEPRRITLEGHGVTIADVVAVARGEARVVLGADARSRVVAARAVVDRLAASDVPFYGVNTALGANTGNRIPPDELVAYQERAVLARAVGIGPRFSTDVVRAIMFTRAAGMAVGGSGVSPGVLEALIAMLNARVHPIVPAIGSIGAADLAPLSHLALPLIGRGEAEYHGHIMPGAAALALASVQPTALTGKDGLALISSNAATVGHASLVIHDALAVLDAQNVSAALSFEGFRANLSPLDPRVQTARPAPGQQAVAARLTQLLADSALWRPGSARRVQDPLSFRCVTQVHGAALSTAWTARDYIELELNSAAESPLVLIEPDEMLSNGNFHAPGLAIAFDAFGLGLAQCSALCAERCIKSMSPQFSGLPLQLTRHGPAHSGFATIQKTLAALHNRVRHAANPACLDFLPVSEGVEDHAPMTANVVAKTAAIVDDLRFLTAIEMLVAAQAIDLRELDRNALGRGTRAAFEAVRREVAMLDGDRPLGPDIEIVERRVRAGDYCAIGASQQ